MKDDALDDSFALSQEFYRTGVIAGVLPPSKSMKKGESVKQNGTFFENPNPSIFKITTAEMKGNHIRLNLVLNLTPL